MTDTPTLSQDLAAIEKAVDDWSARVKAHPRFFKMLAKIIGGFFPKDRDALYAVPRILAAAKQYLPIAEKVESEFQPAPRTGPPLTQADWSGAKSE